MKISKLISKAFILSALFLASCSDDDSPQQPKGDYENGVLIIGEGSGAGTGSVSFISNDLTTTENLIYKKVNATELGLYLQSITFDNDRAFIVVDNANTITVVDRYTFEDDATITTGLETPRYMAIVGNKGYVTNWGSTSDETDDFIAIVDLNTFSVDNTISVGNGPERIVAKDGKLYVSHKGGFTNNNVISVIDIASENVQEVTVKDKPDELLFNSSGNLVVLSEGRTLYDANWNVTGNTLGSISTINTSSLTVSTELNFADGEHPSLMVLDNATLYYELGGKVYSIAEDASALSSTPIVESQGYLYGMEVENDKIYLLDASFTDLSELNIYDLITKNKIDTKSVALGASKIYFN
ncbi:YncE family protein [Flavivirga rizhaonensis]|uniref:Cell surface protein n=1 Tax=Flavivirga rizhaonensis TaxID=2559571 RepID=A0A4S1DYU7_9FLAO|nr:DUF5074 domain-containing protein [Flavivirga rizhaonensis]TGV02732.1 cell surface protein [Flavivirga rizhaonensis]